MSLVPSLYIPEALSLSLRQTVFQAGQMLWPAWSLEQGLQAVEEIRSLSLTVLGGNLVLKTAKGESQTHYTTVNGDYAYSFDTMRKRRERWQEYARRSCDEAGAVLRWFEPMFPVIDPEPYTLGFMLMWQPEHSGTGQQ